MQDPLNIKHNDYGRRGRQNREVPPDRPKINMGYQKDLSEAPANSQPVSATDPVSQMEALKAALKQVEENSPLATEVYNFEIHEDTGRLYVRVEDKDGNLIRQIPSERFIEVDQNVGQMIGLFLDQRGWDSWPSVDR